MPLTASQPKCLTEVAGTRILDWTLRAFQENGLDEFVFVGGYLIDVVRDAYPGFAYVENPAWPTTNILASLVCAREHMADGFYATYTDTLYLDDAVKVFTTPRTTSLSSWTLAGVRGTCFAACTRSRTPRRWS